MKAIMTVLASAGLLVAAGCSEKIDHSVDRSTDSGELEKKVVWGIYVDPDGCDTWIADDGVEGYAVARLEPGTGARVCSGVLPKGYAAGHKKAQGISDPI